MPRLSATVAWAAPFVVVAALLACSSQSRAPRPGPGDPIDSGVIDTGPPCIPFDARDTGFYEAELGYDAGEATVITTPCIGKLCETQSSGSCSAVITNWAYEGATHHPPGTPIAYCSRPPNSGQHYEVWAAYKAYEQPVPAGYLVHSMEHGAVVVWYRCAGSCPEVAKKLQAVIDARPKDPLCDPDAGGPPGQRRIILVPDPALPSEIAASAWQWTYSASCVDPDTLSPFIGAHYAQRSMGLENTCLDGIDPTVVKDSGAETD